MKGCFMQELLLTFQHQSHHQLLLTLLLRVLNTNCLLSLNGFPPHCDKCFSFGHVPANCHSVQAWVPKSSGASSEATSQQPHNQEKDHANISINSNARD